MKKLEAVLAGRIGGVFHVGEEVAPEHVEEAAAAAGRAFARADLSAARTREAVLDAVADALRLPEWFGRNLDALEESLGDLDWPKGGVLLLEVGTGAAAAALGSVLDVFRDAAVTWSEEGRPLLALVRGGRAPPGAEPLAPGRAGARKR